MTKDNNPQDRILNHLRKQKTPCTIHTTNGYQLNNVLVRAFDSYVIVIQTQDGKQMMLYKHAVSSFTMNTPIALTDELSKPNTND